MAENKGFTIDIKKKKSVSPLCRGSYVHLLEMRQLPESEKMAYGLQCLFPKNDPAVDAWMTGLKGIYAQVLIDKYGIEKAKALAPGIKTPVRDGDDPKATVNMSDPEPLKGHWFMNANNMFRQPHIIGPAGKPLDPDTLTVDDIYSGAWYRVMLEFWYYDRAGNKGISCSVAAVMKIKDDVNLGAGTTATEAENEFSDFTSEVADVFGESSEEEGETPKEDNTSFDFL